jgi:nicotinamidase/pyrazinamidase
MSTNRSALLVIDVQNDFCPGGSLAVPDGDRVLPALNRHLARAIDAGETVYASRDWHPAVTRHFQDYGGEWPQHCVQGTAGAAFHPALQLPDSVVVVTKGEDPDQPGYSAFEGRTPDGRAFLDDLRARGIDHLSIGGLATDYCVRHSVLDARRLGFAVTVLADAVAGVDVRPGDSAKAIAEMREAGARVIGAPAAGQPVGDHTPRR